MLLERLFEKRSGAVDPVHPRDPALADLFGTSSNTAAGVRITPDSALQLNAVYCAVRVIAESVASLPLGIFRRLDGGGKEPAIDNPLFQILHDQPNRWQTSFEWREMMIGHALLRGNAYSEIVGTNGRPVQELIPLHPDRVLPFRTPDGGVAYQYSPDQGPPRILLASEVHHLRAMSSDGVIGIGAIDLGRESLGLAKAAEEFGARYFGNGTVIGGVLEHPAKLSEEAHKRLVKQWENRHQGVQRSHKTAVLEEGMSWKEIGVPPDKAQFIETRKMQIAEIARLFRVPPHLLGDLERATFSNIEQQGIDFVVHTLRPWLVRWEQALKRDLLGKESRRRHFIEFNVDGLLRGDSAARSQYYRELFNIGVLSQNDIRAKENMNPIPDGDRYYVPLNMIPADRVDEQLDEGEGNGAGTAIPNE